MGFPKLLQKNLYLKVPFSDKDLAKSDGAKWDKELKLWYLPPGLDPLEVRLWWAFLDNAYDDRETIKKMGAKFDGNLKSWWVPNELDFDDFRRWWPIECKQYLFNDRFCCHGMVAKRGQATVYKAWDLVEDEWAAVKLFYPDEGSWNVSEEGAMRELAALERLEGHPNILPLKDYGVLAEEKQYFTVTKWINQVYVDYIEGNANEKALRAIYEVYRENDYLTDTTEEEFLALVESEGDDDNDEWSDEFETMLSPILDAIAFAHEHDIVHRDLKPGNIFFDIELAETKDEDGVMHVEGVKLIPVIGDFGASKDQSRNTPSQQTVVIFRTGPWTPPHEGEELDFQKTWDIHAWAILAISVVCKNIPNTIEEINELLDGRFREEAGDDILAAIARAIDPEPSNRPQDARSYLEEMKALTEKRKKELGL